MKTSVLITGLLLILLANFMALYYAPYGREYFQNANAAPMNADAVATNGNANANVETANAMNMNRNKVEGFSSMSLDSAAGASTSYKPMGQFDGVKLTTGNSVSGWRYTAPNEPLTGAEFVPGDDALFMFKNNQCKPECCGASFSCGGGCVCTTPHQRQYIAARGGNRTEPEDSA
jgi:hypothetical protein